MSCQSNSEQQQEEAAKPITGNYQSVNKDGTIKHHSYYLSLSEDSTAQLITDTQNFKPEIQERGTWKTTGSNITLDLRGIGQKSERIITLEKVQDHLVIKNIDKNDTTVVTLKKTDQLPPSEKELIMWIHPEKKDCVGVGPMKCIQVQYGMEEPVEGEWLLFYSAIEGFDITEGKIAQLKVKRVTRENVPQDASKYQYTLMEKIQEQDLKD
ncbi:hypothetical protein GCM10023331_20310 [Algivirga pacifica]|uniref:DUF4377 domain-containing protein n=2 Tax=Algivirga pacifica TaxID=1162670 RepID=A0ABP9D9A0_9BACT